MVNSLYPWLALSFALLVMPAARAQTPNSAQYYIDHPAERRATELRCYQQGATGTKADVSCENAERASAAALAQNASKRATRPEQNPASPDYWRLQGTYATRLALQDCINPKSVPFPPTPEDCEAAAVALLGRSR
jgi:hypothetical protein